MWEESHATSTRHDRTCRRRPARVRASGCGRARGGQDRHELFHDRRGLQRRGSAGQRWRPTVCSAARQHGRRQENRNDPARRRRRGRQCAPPRPGDDRQRQGPDHSRRHHAHRARLWTAGDPGEDAHRSHDLGRLGHDDRIALLRAYQFHPGAVVMDHGRVGGEERQQAGGDAGQRMGSGHGS